MELKLTDNSKVSLIWLAKDRLKLELHQPKALHDGHGFTLVGHAILEGTTLAAFLTAVRQEKEEGTAPL